MKCRVIPAERFCFIGCTFYEITKSKAFAVSQGHNKSLAYYMRTGLHLLGHRLNTSDGNRDDDIAQHPNGCKLLPLITFSIFTFLPLVKPKPVWKRNLM